MRLFLVSLLSALLSLATPSVADDQPVVVELFTSQGCSSCPPADALLTRLSKRKDVIALALHVDYWDYLGWPDHFALKAFSQRQRSYAKVAHKRTVYTPQVIVQGISHAVGNRVNDVDSLIRHHGKRADMVELEVSRYGDSLKLSLKEIGGSVGPSVIYLVRYKPQKTVKIRAGENAGREILYSNIVTQWTTWAIWPGHGDLSAVTTISGSDPVVVIVQSEGYGPIIAAYRLR
jgi:hypothetical protein